LAPAHKSLLRLQHKFNKFSAEIGFEKWLPWMSAYFSKAQFSWD
jgi:hypothetical protein